MVRARRSMIVTVVLVTSALLQPTGPVAGDVEHLCGDVQLIHARGTGDDPDDAFFQRVDGRLSDRLNAPIAYSAYQLGKDGGSGGFEYPADPHDDFGQKVNFFLEASVAQGLAYQDSRDEGVNELVAYLNHRVALCPSELYVLTGHSQGADVTGRALAELPAAVLDRIAYVALFGDPRFQTYNVQVAAFVDQCYFPRPPWQRGTSECYSHGWYADDFAPYLPDALLDRAGSWCRDNDVACTGIPQDILTGAEHTKYHTDGDVDMAMQEAAVHLAELDPGMADDIDLSMLQFATGSAGADLAFVFDTTGSMYNEIDDMAAQATSLANLWLGLSPNGRVALVEFRDHGDSFVSRVDLGLTDDSTAFQAAVDALEADEGGDTPEAQLSGLMTTLDELDWQDGATKVAVVITDAPGKDPEPVTGFTRSQVSQRALEIDPVAIYGVDVLDSPDVAGFMQLLATDTAGEVVVLQPGQSLTDLLADLLDSVALDPVATLHGPYFADLGAPVHFSAAGSFDPDGNIVSYEWDFDGDGSSEQTTSGPTVDHTYSGAYSGIAAVRVVSSDGGEALGSTSVTVQAGGLLPVAPVEPAAASASVTGPGQVTVSWTPAADDHADGYTVRLNDAAMHRYVEVGSGSSVTITGLDLTEPRTFSVRAANEYGQSPAAVTNAVGGEAPIVTERVSESSTHGQGNGVSDDAYMSADGRYVTYKSGATNLVPSDTNGVDDAFVHDRLTGTTSRASTDAAGAQGNAPSDDPAISASGRYLVFRSQASNFVTGDTNGTAWDIFVKDLVTGTVTRESVSSSGTQANNASADPVISADGRYVVFRSAATNLVSGDTNGQQDLFLRDRTAGTTTLISKSSGGTLGNGLSDDPTISDDGRYVAYHSEATNLVASDTNAARDVFLYDRTTGATTRVSTTAAGAQGNGVSQQSAISADGTAVAFESLATNLVAGDTNAKQDVFVKTLASGAIVRASVSSAGVQANKASSQAWLSADGGIVAFDSTATNLVASDTNNRSDIFLRAVGLGTTTRVSVATDDSQGNDTSSNPMVSADGATTAFASIASNLVASDTNNMGDVFVHGPAMD